MSAPRLEIRLDLLRHNAHTLVSRLGARGIGVTGVTKVTMGSPEVARELLASGVTGLGDSRVENLEALRAAGLTCPLTLIRSPMPSQADRVVAASDVSLNSELDVLAALSAAAVAQGRTHGVVVMVELGDLREGVLPADLADVVHGLLRLPNLELRGLGTNLACQSGAAPTATNMAELGALAATTEAAFGIRLPLVSGGNSANLTWALGTEPVGRVNDLRLGEAIVLGREPLHRQPIGGLHTDAVTLVGEVIESRCKPSVPTGALGQTAFGAVAAAVDRGDRWRVLLALGRQDVDPAGLEPPVGYTIVGASSDHLVLDAGDHRPAVGDELRFGVGYGALLAAATSPFVAREYLGATTPSSPD